MPSPHKAFRFDLSPLKWLVKQFQGFLPDPLPKQWGVRYSAFLRRRFVRMSGGGWTPLAESTKAARRLAGKGAKILRDTGTLLSALTIGHAGNLFKKIRGGVRFGFGGGASHPDGGATIAQIARWHDAGSGNLPQRQIVVEPDAKTIRGMAGDVKRSVVRVGKKAERRLPASMKAAFSTLRRL